MDGIYLTWMISAMTLGILLMPVFKPPWVKLTLPTFVDFFRRYWMHLTIVFIIYNSKDLLDQVDRIIIANTGLDMTPLIYGIEGSLVPLGGGRFLLPDESERFLVDGRGLEEWPDRLGAERLEPVKTTVV